MSHRLLLLLSSDPTASGRVAEAVRFAAGLAVGRVVEVALYLHGPAVKALEPDCLGLVDADTLRDCWPLLADCGCIVAVESGRLSAHAIRAPAVAVEECSAARLRELLGRADTTVHFDAALGGIITGCLSDAPAASPGSSPATPVAHRLGLQLANSAEERTVPYDLSVPHLDYLELLAALFRMRQTTVTRLPSVPEVGEVGCEQNRD